jgi:hypothetical protein
MKSINFYDRMKSIEQKNFNSGTYWAEMVETLQTKFEYKGLDPKHDPPPEYIEKCLITTGCVGFGRVNDDIVACVGSLCGDPDYYYRGKDFEGVYANGNISGTRGKNVVVGFNNSLYLPDLDIMRYESIFTEIDVSEKINVLFARLLKVPVVGDEKEKEALKDVFSALIKGDFGALVSKNLFKNIADGKNFLDLLELTDVDDIQNLQYLSQYRDNVQKRFYCRHGHSLQTTGKIAQQTTDEVHGMDSVAMIYSYNQLKMRRRMCEEMKLFGRSWTVDFSEVWKVNEKQLVETVENNVESEGEGNEKNTGISDNADNTGQ